MARDMIWSLQGHFVCNKCKEECGHCIKELTDIANGTHKDDDLFPRKQLIGCLGIYCDKPCKRQTIESDLTKEHLLNLVKFLGNRVNNLLENK